MYSIYEKVEAWVVKNGGTIQKLSDKKFWVSVRDL